MDKKVLVFALILLVVLSAVALASNDIAIAQEQNQANVSKTDNSTKEKAATDFSLQEIFTGIIAMAAIIAIVSSISFSLRATAAAHKAAQGGLIMQIGDLYGSPEMLEAMMRLIWWVDKKEEEGKDWLEIFGKERNKRTRDCEIAQVDKDRRKFLNYYEAINTAKARGLLDEKIAKRSENQELFYKMIVGPLTNQIKPKVTEEWPELTVDYPEGYYAKRKSRDIEQKKINDQKKK